MDAGKIDEETVSEIRAPEANWEQVVARVKAEREITSECDESPSLTTFATAASIAIVAVPLQMSGVPASLVTVPSRAGVEKQEILVYTGSSVG